MFRTDGRLVWRTRLNLSHKLVEVFLQISRILLLRVRVILVVDMKIFPECHNPILQLLIKPIDLIRESCSSIQPLRDGLKLLSKLDMFFGLDALIT